MDSWNEASVAWDALCAGLVLGTAHPGLRVLTVVADHHSSLRFQHTRIDGSRAGGSLSFAAHNLRTKSTKAVVACSRFFFGCVSGLSHTVALSGCQANQVALVWHETRVAGNFLNACASHRLLSLNRFVDITPLDWFIQQTKRLLKSEVLKS